MDGRVLLSCSVGAAPDVAIMYSTSFAFSFRSATRLWNACDSIPISSPVGTSISTLRSEEHTSELQSRLHLVCRLLLEKKKKKKKYIYLDFAHERENKRHTMQ